MIDSPRVKLLPWLQAARLPGWNAREFGLMWRVASGFHGGCFGAGLRAQ